MHCCSLCDCVCDASQGMQSAVGLEEEEEDQVAAGQQPGISDAPATTSGQEAPAAKNKSVGKTKVGVSSCAG